ncbi:MAG TPA: Rieske 2Fe-2S domain-containing protein [Ohtaekwangia sp.]
MKIDYLGHAGFLVESEHSIILMDAWLSNYGAFDGGWFQYPRNHHLSDFVKERFQANAGKKNVFVYVSHEHKDHFDADFLKSIESFDFRYLIPSFRRSVLYDRIKAFTSHEIILCNDENTIRINESEYIKIYTDDSELNRDSAILFSDGKHKFLNLNDCKIHDRLGIIKQEEGDIDVFAVQFSGATWHPTCYDYPEAEYKRISRKKKLSKFESTAIAIENLNPKAYIPSAGPACFLDPDLIHLNFQEENIFPRNEQIIEYLQKRLKKVRPEIFNMMPGDTLAVNGSVQYIEQSKERVTEQNVKEYIFNYASNYRDFFDSIKKPLEASEFKTLLDQLVTEFRDKLDNFKSKNQIDRSLYIGFIDQSAQYIEVNFHNDYVKLVDEIYHENFYLLRVNSYDIKRVLQGYLTWEDFSLTFRMRLNRKPDVYQVLMQGFLILEKTDLNYFCEKILEIENRNERIIVEVGGIRYSIDRYCPHQGADLKYAWSENDRHLVCPRHRWAFDLEDQGNCKINSACINAIPLESD